MPGTVSVASVATAVFEELSKLEGEERKRALHGALAMLGETAPASSGGGGGAGTGASDTAADTSTLPMKAKAWMRVNAITDEHLSPVFHMEGGTVELIASEVPGSGKGKQTMNVYLLRGIASLLATGDAKIDDKEARETATNLGCYDQANHANNFNKEKANYLTGSKSAGWTLTTPGQKAAAELIKAMHTS